MRSRRETLRLTTSPPPPLARDSGPKTPPGVLLPSQTRAGPWPNPTMGRPGPAAALRLRHRDHLGGGHHLGGSPPLRVPGPLLLLARDSRPKAPPGVPTGNQTQSLAGPWPNRQGPGPQLRRHDLHLESGESESVTDSDMGCQLHYRWDPTCRPGPGPPPGCITHRSRARASGDRGAARRTARKVRRVTSQLHRDQPRPPDPRSDTQSFLLRARPCPP